MVYGGSGIPGLDNSCPGAADQHYERLLASSDRTAVAEEGSETIAPLRTSRDFVRDPVMLEFLGLPGVGKLLEADLERALLNNLQEFCWRSERGLAFVARQFRVSTESKDFYIDLVFYNYLLKCFVLFDLKSGELTHQDIGQWISTFGWSTT